MRVLFLTGHLPGPGISGGRLREHELLRRIALDCDVHLVAISETFEQDVAAAELLDTFCESVTVLDARATRDDLPTQLRRNPRLDVVHVEGYHLLQHVPQPCPAPVLLVEPNVAFSLWQQRIAIAGGYSEQRAAFREYRETRTHERDAWRSADLCAAVTEDDRAAMLRLAPELDVRVVEDGIDHLGAPSPDRPEPQGELVFVANFASEPNADAARWLCSEILPRVRKQVPHVRALLVGNEPPPDVLGLGCEHVEVTGHVPRVEGYLDRAAVVVSPLRVGGGIKVNVLEALCRGKAIVTTSVGAQGLAEEGASALLVADKPAAFARAVAGLLLDPTARRELERRALDFADTLPTWDDAAASLRGCYGALVRERSLA